MSYFVEPGSIVRTIWAKSETVLLIFAGASAEFALHKTVDWLYFTGKLPQDPVGRLFSTVSYAQSIVFSHKAEALSSIDAINHIHGQVEAKRGTTIPNWAYRDVLFMLIDYSIRGFELLNRKLTPLEKEEIFRVFMKVGKRMFIEDLPHDFITSEAMRKESLKNHLEHSPLTKHLFGQYRKQLGPIHFQLLQAIQGQIVPEPVRRALHLKKYRIISPMINLYHLSRWFHLDRLIKDLLLPTCYKEQIQKLDWELSAQDKFRPILNKEFVPRQVSTTP